MNLRLAHPRLMVALLLCTVLALAALLEYDSLVLEQNIVALRYCIEHGVSQ